MLAIRFQRYSSGQLSIVTRDGNHKWTLLVSSIRATDAILGPSCFFWPKAIYMYIYLWLRWNTLQLAKSHQVENNNTAYKSAINWHASGFNLEFPSENPVLSNTICYPTNANHQRHRSRAIYVDETTRTWALSLPPQQPSGGKNTWPQYGDKIA